MDRYLCRGIRVINLRTGAVKAYTHSRGIPNTICSNDVLCIYKGRKGEIYVGTSWGLCRYDAARDNFMTITSVGSMVSVVDIYEDMYNHLWIATSNSGVFSYNTMNAHWKHYQHEREDSTTITSNSVITLFEDTKGTMWFGTNGEDCVLLMLKRKDSLSLTRIILYYLTRLFMRLSKIRR